MVNNQLPVVVSGTFFYQSWSHGGSMLPVSQTNKAQGIVQYPSPEDQTDSRMRPAGHGILLVGFDNDMRVQRVNGMGQPEVNAAGEPVYDTGFYLFKNSWNNTWATTQVPGTTEHPGGFGWISQRYVQEFMQAYVSGLPRVTQREVCDDRRDNDSDGRIDCMDTDCTMAAACRMMPTMGATTATPRAAIPDNNPTGVSSEINITEAGQVASLALDLDVAHTYRGDLRVTLTHGDRTVTVVDRTGAGADNIMEAFSLADFNGADATGIWRLTVVDTASADTGTLNSWGLRITRCMGSCGGTTETTRRYENTTARDIPDNSTAGVTSEIQVTDRGTIRRLTATVTVEHAFPADLRIALRRVGGREVVLFDRQDVTDSPFTRTYTVDAYADQELSGNWRLIVSDRAARDTGRLVSWSLDATTR